MKEFIKILEKRKRIKEVKEEVDSLTTFNINIEKFYQKGIVKEYIEFLKKYEFTEEVNRLTSLNVDGGPDADKTALDNRNIGNFIKALENNNTLTSLKIIRNDIGDAGITKIIKVLENNTTLTSLDLSINSITDRGAAKIGELLKSNSTLASLVLDSNKITDEGAAKIGEALEKNTVLTDLDLSKNRIENTEKIGKALKYNTTLTNLDLSENEIWDAAGIAEGLKNNVTLTSLAIYRIEDDMMTDIPYEVPPEGAQKIEKLLKRNNFFHKQLKKLAVPLHKHVFNKQDNIVEIVSIAKFYKKTNEALEKYLQKTEVENAKSKLDELNKIIENKPFAIAGVCKEIQAEEALPVRISLNVANHILELPKEILLKITFCLDGIPWGLEAARKKIKALIDFLEEKGFATEANDFKNGDTTLNLNNKNIKDEGAKVIGEGLKASTSLTVLNLQGNEITNEGVEAISNGLKINTSLTLLNLENNLIEKEGTKTIVEALETNTSLLSLDLNGNNIEVESKNIIQVYIERNKKISNEKTAKLEGSKLSSGVTTNIVKEIIYDNLLLNHPELLASSLRKFSLQKIGELSENLDHNLIQQAINNNDSELVLAGLTSLLGGAEIL